MGKREITVGYSGEIKGNDSFCLQKAVDLIHKEGGGKVIITDGNYEMYNSLHIRSNVHVIGEKKAALIKGNIIRDDIDGYLGYGHTDVFVKNAEKFRKGMGIYITDDRSCCFYDTVATITGIEGNRLLLDTPLNHDFGEKYQGVVHTSFPVVSFVNCTDASIKNISIKGNSGNNVYCGGCRAGAVYMLLSRNIKVSELDIQDYNGDGISFQQCINIKIKNNTIKNNKGSGIHPGSGSVSSLIENNVICDNKEDGIFYCLRVSFSTAIENTITGNRRNGISIGHRDIKLDIQKNSIENNSDHGLFFREEKLCGDDSIIKKNKLTGNDLSYLEPPINTVIQDNEGIEDFLSAEKEIKAGYKAYHKGQDDRHLMLGREK
ncbi:MAG: right-handed parallel beta-helix repeat-containing protein [Clostridia bacterium]|nr:right-handed parallel beta-helix repeat-containing protein [Clostridia bacterium]